MDMVSSSSIFSCSPNYAEPKNKICIFEGVSPCRDHVSQVICNAHAELFGLIYKTASYHNGENDVWSKIVTYISSNNSLNIPLFVDASNKIILDEVRTFCLNVKNNFPTIKLDVLENRIACLCGLNQFGGATACRYSWFDDVGSYVIVRNRNANVSYTNNIPQLHKALFYHTQPSNIRNSATNATTYLVANVSLTYNDTSNNFAFVVPNKSILLKYTTKNDCVATPVVIDGARDSAQRTSDRTFKPLRNFYPC